MNTNPYEAPVSNFAVEYEPVAEVVAEPVLASRSTRLVAAFIDGILILLATIPIMIVMIFALDSEFEETDIVSNVLMTVGIYGIMFALNGYWLSNRGQTIGKYLFKIQIVDEASNRLLPLMRVFVIRYLWTLPLGLLFVLIPEGDKLERTVNFVDAVMIFGAAQRCLHDYLAGSKVVVFQPNRPRL